MVEMQRADLSSKDIPVDTNPGAPIIYVDGLQGFGITDGIVKINVIQDLLVASNDAAVKRQVAARLVMTFDQLKKIGIWINTRIDDVEKALQETNVTSNSEG